MSNYPLGSNTKDAPWNQYEPPEEELFVDVSIILTKRVKVLVTDYEVTKEYDGSGYYSDCDFSDCDIDRAVKEQIDLPNKEGWGVEELIVERV